jgi:putative N6-adenine-specific DNA methylase
MKKYTLDMFAVVAPGLEAVCARELNLLKMDAVSACKGGVMFRGGLEELYRANLWLRSASRVLVRLGSFGSRDFPDLYRKLLRLPWGRFVKPGTRLQVKASSCRSRLQHTGRISETVQDAAHRALGGGSVCEESLSQQILVRFENDQCLVSVDSSGELLHRRGYRRMIGAAPMRETLAAGILMMLGWTAEKPLVDPMCGSGTFVIEGALMGGGRASGMNRQFAFMQWPRYRPGLWNVLITQARSVERTPQGLMFGYDIDAKVIEGARLNAARAGVGSATRFFVGELGHDVEAMPQGKGLVVCNPPYGARLGDEAGLLELYRQLGVVCRSVYSGWQGAVLCPPGSLAKALGKGFDCFALLNNGGIEVGLYRAFL